MKRNKTTELKITRGHLIPLSSICIMDLAALWTTPFLHGNRLAHTDSVLAYGHCGTDVKTDNGTADNMTDKVET